MRLIIDIPEEKYKAITEMYETFPKDMKDWGLEAIKNGTTVEMSEDCVSREAVKKITWEEPSYDDALNVLTEVRDKVKALPPVKPQRPKGRWLDKKMTIKGAHGMTYGRYACSVCKKKFPNKSNYCPNCGAKMEVEG